ncbi:hypothetical protein RJ639_020856 [Escallonia herrerae]|uniref:STAS domain-containing protein n=1 Tax=Escallonia herrerae TaxID=1293975 RepID=A0AA88V3L5_9ASTE|nr:hypothetical protein RJ639_020856 [Escallonia herrerae]
MSPVTDIDTSGVHALEELRRSLQKRDVQNDIFAWNTTNAVPRVTVSFKISLYRNGPIYRFLELQGQQGALNIVTSLGSTLAFCISWNSRSASLQRLAWLYPEIMALQAMTSL